MISLFFLNCVFISPFYLHRNGTTVDGFFSDVFWHCILLGLLHVQQWSCGSVSFLWNYMVRTHHSIYRTHGWCTSGVLPGFLPSVLLQMLLLWHFYIQLPTNVLEFLQDMLSRSTWSWEVMAHPVMPNCFQSCS